MNYLFFYKLYVWSFFSIFANYSRQFSLVCSFFTIWFCFVSSWGKMVGPVRSKRMNLRNHPLFLFVRKRRKGNFRKFIYLTALAPLWHSVSAVIKQLLFLFLPVHIIGLKVNAPQILYMLSLSWCGDAERLNANIRCRPCQPSNWKNIIFSCLQMALKSNKWYYWRQGRKKTPIVGIELNECAKYNTCHHTVRGWDKGEMLNTSEAKCALWLNIMTEPDLITWEIWVKMADTDHARQ